MFIISIHVPFFNFSFVTRLPGCCSRDEIRYKAVLNLESVQKYTVKYIQAAVKSIVWKIHIQLQYRKSKTAL